MKHRERALAAINHQVPDRVPILGVWVEDAASLSKHLGLDAQVDLDKHYGADFRWLTPEKKDGSQSFFGNSGSQLPYGVALNDKPFANVETVGEIEKFNWPELDIIDFVSFQKNLEQLRQEYAIIVGNWTSVFCEVCDFFGMENTLVHMQTNPALIEATVARIEDFYLRYCRKLFASLAGKADIFHMWDDFSSQRGMIFSPEMWRRFYKPTYRKMFEIAKSHGLYVWFHSCGIIREVLPDLIDIGMDIWETVQAHLPGNEPERLKQDFGDNITFYGAINTQHTLPFGTAQQVRDEVRHRIKVLGRGGGYICGSDHVIKAGTPPENIAAMFDEILNFRHTGCTL
jgi:uroporphyrinogen decarboxylase